VKIPAGTTLAAGSFYLLGLSNSGLAVPARAGDVTIHVRSTTGMSVGDAIRIDNGANVETRKIVNIGTAAGNTTTVWQPVPEGPVITIPAGSTEVPVTSVAGFAVGEKIGIGYGATYPAIAKTLEKYEVATVTAIGKPGTQAFLGADAKTGATHIKVTSVANISAGDRIRLDIDSMGHGIETVTVTKVGTQSSRTSLAANANAGATNVNVRGVNGFVIGDKLTIGTPANQETVTITAVGSAGQTGVEFTPALARAHLNREDVVAHGSGLDLSAPLKFNHAANLPFSVRGTGISFKPATAFTHSSNEPVQPLGTGITLDRPLSKAHAIDGVVRDDLVMSAGYQGTRAPNQWFGECREHGIARRRGSRGGQPELWRPCRPMGLRGLSGHFRSRGEWLPRADSECGGPRWRARRRCASSKCGPLSGWQRHRQQLHRFPVAVRNHVVGSFDRRRDKHQGRQCGGLCCRPDDHVGYGCEPRDCGFGERWHGRRFNGRNRDQRGCDCYSCRQRGGFHCRSDHQY
jgi:hypothetical protein